MANVERARGICADVLEEYLRSLSDIRESIATPFCINVKERLPPAVLFQNEIDEAGPGYFRRFEDPVSVLYVPYDDLGYHPGRLGLGLCERHRQGGSQVPVVLRLRGLERNYRMYIEFQVALVFCPGKGLCENVGDGLFH